LLPWPLAVGENSHSYGYHTAIQVSVPSKGVLMNVFNLPIYHGSNITDRILVHQHSTLCLKQNQFKQEMANIWILLTRKEITNYHPWSTLSNSSMTTKTRTARELVSAVFCSEKGRFSRGIETSTVPLYQAELCEASKCGKLVCSEPLLVGVGIVISYFFDYGMSFVGGQIAWRLPIACQMIFAFISDLSR
jgi:hypothetical protein